MAHVLFVGLTHANLSKAQADFASGEQRVNTYAATTLEEVRDTFVRASEQGYQIHHVFMGAGIDLEKRTEIVKAVFTFSCATHVHLKNALGGKEGFVPFVRSTLAGFLD